jgi:hypothetical protein
MMTKSRVIMTLSAATVATLLAAAFNRSAIIGWWRGEAQYSGKYTNYWHDELRAYDISHVYIRHSPGSRWVFARPERPWRVFIAKRFPGLITLNGLDLHPPPLQDGDLKAVAVLTELLNAPESHVRSLAARGLESVGPAAKKAVPALLRVAQSPDGLSSNSAWEALLVIDPDAARKNSCPIGR